MSVSGSDILEYQSVSAGSTGGAISGSTITSGIANNVWANITDSERIAGIIAYRKTFWKNTHSTDDAVKPVLYVGVVPTNAALVLGLGVNSADDADPAQGNMSAFSANARVSVQGAVNGRVATVYGLDNAGTPVPTVETLVMDTTEKLTVATFSKVFGVFMNGIDAGDVVTVRQGLSGTTRGTIGTSKKGCWLWLPAATKGAGIQLPNLPAGQNYGLWRRLTVSAGAGAVRPDTLTVRFEENA